MFHCGQLISLPYDVSCYSSIATDVLGDAEPIRNFSGSILDPLAKVFTPTHTFSRSIPNSNEDTGKICSKSRLNPLAKACYPNIVSFTASVLNPMAKPWSTPTKGNPLAKLLIPSLYDSVTCNVTIPESVPNMNLVSLNPLALPFVSNLGKEADSLTCNSNICCGLHAMDTTPILNSISTPDLSLCGEDFSDDLMWTSNSSCESIIFNDGAGVSTSEAQGALNPCAESFVLDDVLISTRIDCLLNPHNPHNAPSRTANPNVQAPAEVLPPSLSTSNSIAQIGENDDPKSLLQEL